MICGNFSKKHLKNNWGKSTLESLQSISKGYTANVGIQGTKETEGKCCASRRIENVINKKSHCVKTKTISPGKVSASEVSRWSWYCPLLLTSPQHWTGFYYAVCHNCLFLWENKYKAIRILQRTNYQRFCNTLNYFLLKIMSTLCIPQIFNTTIVKAVIWIVRSFFRNHPSSSNTYSWDFEYYKSNKLLYRSNGLRAAWLLSFCWCCCRTVGLADSTIAFFNGLVWCVQSWQLC